MGHAWTRIQMHSPNQQAWRLERAIPKSWAPERLELPETHQMHHWNAIKTWSRGTVFLHNLYPGLNPHAELHRPCFRLLPAHPTLLTLRSSLIVLLFLHSEGQYKSPAMNYVILSQKWALKCSDLKGKIGRMRRPNDKSSVLRWHLQIAKAVGIESMGNVLDSSLGDLEITTKNSYMHSGYASSSDPKQI